MSEKEVTNKEKGKKRMNSVVLNESQRYQYDLMVFKTYIQSEIYRNKHIEVYRHLVCF